MRQVKIDIPKGFEVDSFNKETGELKFKEIPVSITERMKTVEDILTASGTTVDKFNKLYKGLPDHVKSYVLATMICSILNEDWTPNWDDSNEYKYYPWFKMSASGFSFDDYGYWRTNSIVGSRLCFKNRELAKYAGTQFKEVYEQFMVIT